MSSVTTLHTQTNILGVNRPKYIDKLFCVKRIYVLEEIDQFGNLQNKKFEEIWTSELLLQVGNG